KSKPPKVDGVCDNCGTQLIQRPDDTAEVVKSRIEEYRQKTSPLVAFYKDRNLLIDVDGVATPAHVEHRIESALNNSVRA
ncbi:MAG: adenylate kinase, partial [Clostridia bacterium]|nr:adenylate kinase [Deltaproteobacteria bacterium]